LLLAFCLFLIPVILAQNEALRLASFDPAFNFEGLVVTAVLSFDPGLAAL